MKKIILFTFMLLLIVSAFAHAHPLDGDGFTATDVAWVYMQLGYTHILPFGIDHILFILGLYFLNSDLKTVLIQATAFTLAHSITLSLAAFHIIAAPSSIIEPIIALSIVFVAVENIVTKKLYSWRIVIVFIFGLIHGMGFASVLFDLGLPDTQYVNALIMFNIGVELGQVTVIMAAYMLVGRWFREKVWYRQRVVIPVSIVIAIIALYWTFERLQ